MKAFSLMIFYDGCETLTVYRNFSVSATCSLRPLTGYMAFSLNICCMFRAERKDGRAAVRRLPRHGGGGNPFQVRPMFLAFITIPFF
jgi:hypothetical protein